MLTPTRPYWLSLATDTAMVEMGVAVPDEWALALCNLVAHHDTALSSTEPLVRAWAMRPVREGLRSAVSIYEDMALQQQMGLAGELRQIALDMDHASALCAEPQAWHIGYVSTRPYKMGVDPHHGVVPYSTCLLAPSWQPKRVHEYFKALTSLGHIPATGASACYGFCLQREMDEDFVSPIEIGAILKQRLLPLLRSTPWPDSQIPWGEIDAFMSGVLALSLDHSTLVVDEGVSARRL